MFSRKPLITGNFKETHTKGISKLKSQSLWIQDISEETAVNIKISLTKWTNCTHVHIACKLFCLPACF